MNRRDFMRVGAAGLALPSLLLNRARAQGAPGPKRLVIVHSPQGTSLRHFVPRGDARAFELPLILEPLAPLRDRVAVVTGVDNRVPAHNEVGNAHVNANYTVYTGRPFLAQDADGITPGGPSVEQVLAGRIGGQTPFPRLDFAVGGRETAGGILTPREGAYFWHGPNDPVAAFNEPFKALLRLFGDDSLTPAEARALRDRRRTVLATTLTHFDRVRAGLRGEDRARLEAHADKIRALEARITAGVRACAAPAIRRPPGYRPGLDDDVSAPLMNDLLVTALGCDLTRVATLTFANGHAPEFPWLRDANGGRPIVDLDVWENWHAVVHADYQPGMEVAYRWYLRMFADLLGRMAQAQDADGDNLLDTSLVVYLSEYSSGRHWNNTLPIVLAGAVEGGRWLNYMDGSVDDYEASNGYRWSGFTTNQLWTSILRMFGGDDEAFGLVADDLPAGGLPGL